MDRLLIRGTILSKECLLSLAKDLLPVPQKAFGPVWNDIGYESEWWLTRR